MPIDDEDDSKESTQILKRWVTGAIMFVIGVVLGVGLERQGPVKVAIMGIGLAGVLAFLFGVLLLQDQRGERGDIKKTWLIACVVIGGLVAALAAIWNGRH